MQFVKGLSAGKLGKLLPLAQISDWLAALFATKIAAATA